MRRALGTGGRLIVEIVPQLERIIGPQPPVPELPLNEAGAGYWQWDLEGIRTQGLTDNVAELMVAKLKRLPTATQQALMLVACIGTTVDVSTLTLAGACPETRLQTDLKEALAAGLLLDHDGAYRFLHDRVREAAYGLIPEKERAARHLQIGWRLFSKMSETAIKEKIFDIVGQLNVGAELIIDQDEKYQVSELNLVAGQRAKTSTAYVSALKYLAAGRALLAEESWRQRYALTFAIELHLAQCEFLTGALPAAEERLARLWFHAKSFVDAAAVASLRMTLYTSMNRRDRGVEVGLACLRRVGVNWSPHPTRDKLRREYEQLLQRIGTRPIETLVDLPEMSDPDQLALLKVLMALYDPASKTDQNLLGLVFGRMVNLSLEYGNRDVSSFAYIGIGSLLAKEFGDQKAEFRFGKLGLDLVEKRGLDHFKARVYLAFATWSNLWERHVRTSIDLLQNAFASAQAAGDLTYSVYSCACLVTTLLATGDPLGKV